MINEKFRATLDSRSLLRLEVWLKDIVKDKEKEAKSAIEDIIEYGFRQAHFHIQNMNAIESGKLYNSIRKEYYPDKSGGKLFVEDDETYEALFVEYGTGVRGANNPHPINPWQYMANSDTNYAAGWVYYDEFYHAFFITHGMESRPFWLNTIKDVGNYIMNKYQKKVIHETDSGENID